MIDSAAALLAFRNRAIALVAGTTGATDLAATSTGYTRLAGSFVTDGFYPGMELVPTGFTQTDPGVITRVQALTLTIDGGRTVQASGSGRTLVVGLPAQRAWENVHFDPDGADRPYAEDSFSPGPSELISGPARGGMVIESGLWICKYYGLSNYADIGILKLVDALKARFTSGTPLTAGSNTVRVGEKPGPWAGKILPQGNGRSVCLLTVPWWAESTNAIAA